MTSATTGSGRPDRSPGVRAFSPGVARKLDNGSVQAIANTQVGNALLLSKASCSNFAFEAPGTKTAGD